MSSADSLMRSSFKALVTLALVFYAAGVMAAKCDFMEREKRPNWVTKSASGTAYVYGVGSATGKQGDAGILRDASLAAARKDLAESVVVSVSTDTTLELSKQSARTDQTFKSISRLSSSVQLTGISAADRWLDRRKCTLYTLVKISAREAEAMASDAFLSEVVAAAADRSKPYASRRAYFDQAQRVLNRAQRKDLVPTQLAAYPQVEALAQSMSKAERVRQEYADRLASIDTLLKSGSRAQQRNGYRALLVLAKSTRFDPDIDTGAEPVYDFAARAELARGESCAARRFAGDLQRYTAFDYWQTRAEQFLSVVGAEDSSCPMGLAEILGGLDVVLVCQYRVSNTVRQWDRLCAELGEQMRSVQSNVTVVASAGAAFASLLAGAKPSGISAQQPLLVAAADGRIENRASERQTGASDYRFVGQIYLRIETAGETAYQDVFSATTGWNPVSADMVMDILALNIAQRLDKDLDE